MLDPIPEAEFKTPAWQSDTSQRLKGKVALVTGAGSGIGQATALLFTRQGAQVFASDINEQSLRATSAQAAAAGFPLGGKRRWHRRHRPTWRRRALGLDRGRRFGGFPLHDGSGSHHRFHRVESGVASHEGTRRRLHRHDFIGKRAPSSAGVPRLVSRRGQGRGLFDDPSIGHGRCAARHPRQFDITGLDRQPGDSRRGRRPRTRGTHTLRSHDPPARAACGHRLGCPLPRFG